jgi:hypothetical protein
MFVNYKLHLYFVVINIIEKEKNNYSFDLKYSSKFSPCIKAIVFTHIYKVGSVSSEDQISAIEVTSIIVNFCQFAK